MVYRAGVEIHEEHGGAEDTTNNAMELTGMLKAVLWLRANRALAAIHCDSKYVVQGCCEWRLTWARNGWKTRQKTPVINLEIWQALAKALDERPVLPISIHWVKGHAGIAGNERADELTMIGASEAAGIPIAELYDMEARMRRAQGARA